MSFLQLRSPYFRNVEPVAGVVSVAITQVAAVVTASGGTQVIASTASVAIAQLAATVTATGGTQVVATQISTSVTQAAATVTAGGGTQAIATVNNVSLAPVAGTVTTVGGTQVVATVNNVALTQVAGVVTAGGGTQVVTTVQKVAITQVAAVVTAGGGTQVIASVNIVAITQVAGVVTAGGGTQVITTVSNAAITQVAGTVTAGGGIQTVSAGSVANVNIAQVGATVTATGGTQLAAISPVIPTISLVSDGFESGIAGWASAGSTVSQSTDFATEGTHSAKFVAASTTPTLQKTPYTSDVDTYVYVKFKYYFTANPTAATVISRLRTAAFGQTTGLKLATNGDLVGKNADGTDGGTIASALTPNSWHKIEHWYDSVTGFNIARVDDSVPVTWINNTPTSWSKYQIGMIQSTTLTGYYDEVSVAIGEPGLYFNGVSDMVDLGDSADFSVPTTGAITIAAWMRPDVLTFADEEGTGYVHWLSKVDTLNNEWVFRMYGADNTEGRANRISFYVYAQNGLPQGDGVAFQDTLTAGEWIHVVGSIDSGGHMKMYRDGILRNSFTTALTLTDTTTPVRIGSGAQNANPANRSYFQGGIDRVLIWNRQLSDSEVTDAYRGAPTTSGMVASYRMDEGYGSTVNDITGSRTATVSNGQWILADPPIHMAVTQSAATVTATGGTQVVTANSLLSTVSRLALLGVG